MLIFMFLQIINYAQDFHNRFPLKSSICVDSGLSIASSTLSQGLSIEDYSDVHQ